MELDNPIFLAYKTLHEAGVDAILIGGSAVILHGSAYVTQDIDFCCPRDTQTLERLAAALNTLSPRFRVQGLPEGMPAQLDARTLRAGDSFAFITKLGNLDIRFAVDGVGDYDAVKALSEEFATKGASISILSLDGLIASKRTMGRPRDLLVLPELEMMREAKNVHETGSPGISDSGEREDDGPSLSPPRSGRR